MKKVLITGACGYIGARLSKYLAEKGFRVTVFDNINPSAYKKWISLMEEVIVGDVCNENTVASLAKKKFDCVIHLISLDHKKSEDKPNYVSSINVMPTWNLLDQFVEAGIEKFINFSSIQVYGSIENKIITEDKKPEPLNAYGLTHLLSENISDYYNNKGTKCISVRLSNSYGSPIFFENNCWWLVLNDLCKSAFEKDKLTLLSDGTPQRDFIHGLDICNGIKILLDNDINKLKFDTYNISSGQTLTILELAKKVQSAYKFRYNKEIPINIPNHVPPNGNGLLDQRKYLIDNSRMVEMGFTTKIKLNSGINEIFDYLEKNSK